MHSFFLGAWFFRGCVCGFFGGECMVFRGGLRVFFRGVWFLGGSCMVFWGHACLFWGGCMVFWGGHALFFFRGTCMAFFAGVVHGFFVGGVCVFFGFFRCIGYNEKQSMSGRCASYWNAVLFTLRKANAKKDIALRWFFLIEIEICIINIDRHELYKCGVHVSVSVIVPLE